MRYLDWSTLAAGKKRLESVPVTGRRAATVTLVRVPPGVVIPEVAVAGVGRAAPAAAAPRLPAVPGAVIILAIPELRPDASVPARTVFKPPVAVAGPGLFRLVGLGIIPANVNSVIRFDGRQKGVREEERVWKR